MISVVLVALVAADAVLAVLPDDDCCGKPAIEPDLRTRIVGGKEAKPNSWPWQLEITYESRLLLCGASLLSPDTVLTAAHCVHKFQKDRLKVVAGLHYIDDVQPKSQVSKVKDVIIHENYIDKNLENDIAIIKLASKFNLNDYISTICMPSRTTVLPHNTTVYVTGWGHLKDNGKDSSTLQQVAVNVIDGEICNRQSYYNGELLPGMICAGFEAGGKDACQNDSGGPLVAKIDGRWEQYGVVSWGYGCAAPKKPGVYADVVYYSSWISSTLSKLEQEKPIARKFKPVPIGAAFRR